MATLAVYCLPVVLVGATFGNILIIMAVYMNSNLQTLPNYLLVNLAVSEAFRGLIAIPVRLVNVTNGQKSEPISCIVVVLVNIFFHGLPNWSLVLIAFDRFVAVKKPLSYKTLITPFLVGIIIASAWILMFVLVMMPVLGWGEKERDNILNSTCGLDTTLQRSYIILQCLIIDVIPFFIIVGLYSQVLAAVRGQVSRQRKREGILKRLHKVQHLNTNKAGFHKCSGLVNFIVRSNENLAMSLPNLALSKPSGIELLSFERTNTECLCPCAWYSEKNIHKYTIQSEREHHASKVKLDRGNLRTGKATRTVTCIIFFFILLCFPTTVLDLVKLFRTTCNPPRRMTETFSCLVYFNACVNVFIYGWCNRRFRKTFFSIFRKIKHHMYHILRCHS